MVSLRPVLIALLLLAAASNIGGVSARERKERRLKDGQKLRDERFGVTREQIIENRDKRREQLERLLTQTKEKVSDHEAGRRKLEAEELESFTKRIDMYEKKLEKMRLPMDDREIERMIEREQLRAERFHREL